MKGRRVVRMWTTKRYRKNADAAASMQTSSDENQYVCCHLSSIIGNAPMASASVTKLTRSSLDSSASRVSRTKANVTRQAKPPHGHQPDDLQYGQKCSN